MLLNFFKKINLWIVLILLIPLILNIIWFRNGNIMGAAESGLPFYNFQIAYDSNKNAWADYALGFPTNISISAKPTYWLLAQIQNMGIPGFVLQASFFWLVLAVSGISIYSISKILFPELGNKFLFLSVLFYWFNSFSMVNVWNRFLNNFFVFYMLLPVAFLIFLKGIKSKKYIYVFYLGLVSVFFSYALSSVAFNILLWMVLSYCTLFYIFIYEDLKSKLFVFKFFLFSLFFWCLLNIWWISQAFSYVYSGSFSTVKETSFTPTNNELILTILSQKLGNLIHVLKFEHGSFFDSANKISWVKLYTFAPVALISSLSVLIIFLPLFFKRGKDLILSKESSLFLSGLILLGILLSMGNNPPFGELFNIVFLKFGFLQVFRNTFEKFGFLLPLAGSPLFAYGIYILYEKAWFKWRKTIYLFFIIWLVGISGLPYWTGIVFTNEEYPASVIGTGYQVKVPDYYKEAANWIKSQKDDFRLLVFPLGGEGITYNWDKGYTGVELSNQLLPVTSVSFQTNIPFYSDISGDLERFFLNKEDFTKVVDILNAKYIMTRSDIDWKARGMRDPQTIFNKLKEKNSQFSLVQTFGGLSFWENKKWKNKKIYTSPRVVSVFPHSKISDVGFLLDDRDVLVGRSTNLNSVQVSEEVVHPVAKIVLSQKLNQGFEGGQDVFPHINFSPTNSFYNLILLKEWVDYSFIKDASEKLDFAIMLLGKRLVEARLAKESNSISGMLIALKGYAKIWDRMPSIFSEYRDINPDYDKQRIKQEEFYEIFSKHKYFIDNLARDLSENIVVTEKLQKTKELIDSKINSENIQPVYGFKEDINFPINKRIVYKFNITEPGDYDLLLGEQSINKYYEKIFGIQAILQIDNKILPFKVSLNKLGLRDYGKVYFDKGVHEISLNAPSEVNLVDTLKEFTIKVDHGVDNRNFKINNYDPYADYTISFDYWIKKGSGMELFVKGNNAKISSGEIDYGFFQGVRPDNYYFVEKHFTNSFKLNNTTDKAELILRSYPWNDCESIFYTRNKDRCKIEAFRKSYDRTTEIVIKNLSVVRNLIDEPVLIKSSASTPIDPPQTDFKKINNTEYIVNISNAKDAYVLVFSELFDPGWKIFNDSGKEIKVEHFVANTYANGWLINKEGNYKIIVKFVPQSLLKITERMSQVSVIVSLLIITGVYLRRKYV